MGYLVCNDDVEDLRWLRQLRGPGHRRLSIVVSEEHVRQCSGCRAFDEDIGAWDTSKVGNMMQMFDSAHAFNQDGVILTGVDSEDVFAICRGCSFIAGVLTKVSRSWDTSSVRSVPPNDPDGRRSPDMLADEWHARFGPPVRVARPCRNSMPTGEWGYANVFNCRRGVIRTTNQLCVSSA